jgi:N-acetylmuramoyl-L-alanine amidase
MERKQKSSLLFILFTVFLVLIIIICTHLKSNIQTTHTQSVLSNEEITVILDAGHGGEDGGAVGNGSIYEKNLNLAITLKIGEKLKSNGINVVYTRTEDILLYDRNVDYKNRKKALDLAARAQIAEKTPNSIFVSIHMNSFPKTQYSGLQVYYSKNDPLSKPLALAIQTSVIL